LQGGTSWKFEPDVLRKFHQNTDRLKTFIDATHLMRLQPRYLKETIMRQMKYQKVSMWDIAYAVDMAIACLITYWVVAFFLPNLTGKPSTSVGILWAVISTVFVYRDTRSHSLSAGISRLIATLISLALCLSYLWLFPVTSFGMAVLILMGTLVAISLGRRDEVGLTAITTAVVMIVAAADSQNAWQQPLLRLVDTIIGIATGVLCKWAASFMFYKIIGEEVR
jgi:uncharacterized membrane protein YccC